MKKVGYFFAGFLPTLLSISFQFLATFFLIGMGALILAMPSSGIRSAYDLLESLLTLMTDTQFEMGIMALFAVMNIAVFGFWYQKKLGGNFRPDVRRTFDPLQVVGIIVLVPGAQFFCSFFIMLISSIFPSWLEQYERLMETAGMDGSNITVLLILYSVILGPIGEELLFRGVTMRLAGKVFPFWIANIFQAILFGVFHMNLLQGSYAFVL
ncbi:MAG: CPBP family intramembrane metalloprotease, partial [Clostridiales bacterium]|nr:CPBP family intramembrane metalloprotease [Clostridiales bacterium]